MLAFVRQIPFTAGTTEVRDLNAVPSKAPNGLPWAVQGVLLNCRLVLVSASTSDAVAQGEFSRMLNTIMFYDASGKPILTDNPVSGRVLRAMLTYLRRTGYADPASISANSNQTNTREVNFYLPLRLEEALSDADVDAHVFLAEILKGGRIEINWCASDEFGTGQVITAASSYCNVHLDLVPARKLEATPGLWFGSKYPDTFDRWRMPIHGKPLAIAWVDPTAAGLIDATDFTTFEIRGDTLDINRQNLDAAGILYNLAYVNAGDGDDGFKPLQSSGSAEDAPIYVAQNKSDLSKLPTETEPIMTFIVGAGNPSLTEFVIGYVVSRPVDTAHFAEVIGRSSQIPLSTADVSRALTQDPAAKGKNGTVGQNDASWVYPWLKKPVNLNIAGYKG